MLRQPNERNSADEPNAHTDRNKRLYRWADAHPDAAKLAAFGVLCWTIVGPVVGLDAIARAWPVPGVVIACGFLMLVWLGCWGRVLWLRRREVWRMFR